MKKQKDIKFYLIWIALLAYLLILHRFVGIYFDDFGYFTLSYPHYIESISGNVRGGGGILNVFEFLKIHYMEWGGRVFYFGLELIIYKIGGIILLHIIQSLIITAILFTIYKIVNSKLHRPKLVSIIVCCLYGFFTAVVTKESIYWFSASVLYVWPMLPFLILIYKTRFKEEIELKDCIVICICAFTASWSQEQIALTVLAYTIILTIENFWKNHKIKISSLLYSISSLLGFLILYLAPGNFVRKNGDAFYSQGLVQILKISISNLLKGFFSQDNWIFLVLLFGLSSYIAFIIAKKLNKNNIDKNLHFILSIFLGVLSILLFYTKGSILTLAYNKSSFFVYVIFILLIQIIYLHFRYFFNSENLIILFSCIIILAPVLYSAYWVNRMAVPFIFLYFIISAFILTEILINKVKEYESIFIVLLICAVINAAITLGGYQREYQYVTSYNEEILYTASREKYKECSIKLKKCIDDRYTGLMPWVLPEGGGREFVEEEMRRYYDIDESVKFEWE